MNKPLDDALDASQWHHGCCCLPVGQDTSSRLRQPHQAAPRPTPDREGYKWSVAEFSAAFSDIRFIIEEQVAEADKVVTRYTVHATHDRKELLGVAPTGREMASMAIYIHRISGGKITEEWSL